MTEKQYKATSGLLKVGNLPKKVASELKVPLRDVQAVAGTTNYDQYLRNRYKRKDDNGGFDELLRSFGT